MIIDREYPATHSMSTAWYCVDEDGNVGIFDIDDNGPVPLVGEQNVEFVDDAIWDEFPSEPIGHIRHFPLTSEQISSLLLPVSPDDNYWEFEHGFWSNYFWSEIIVRIDVSKYNLLEEALSLDKKNGSKAICLSEEGGWYYLYMSHNKKGVELLESNEVVLEFYKTDHIISTYYDDEFEEGKGDYIKTSPVFIYSQGYSPNVEPAIRTANPDYPLKLSQLPSDIQNKIIKLPIRFKEKKRIQLADFVPVTGYFYDEYVYEGMRWGSLAATDGDPFYYNSHDDRKLSKKEMDQLVASGKAEKYDYRKHND